MQQLWLVPSVELMSQLCHFLLFQIGALPQTLVCPRLSTACPDLFCPFNCAGRGVCNYENVGADGTIQPKCECFDKSDTSPGCSDSQVFDGDFIDNGGDLLDNIEEDFFDPLVAVFVDHPDKWTSASWAWGAGLLTVFLIMLLCICSTFWPEKKGKELEFEEFYRDKKNVSPRNRGYSSSPRMRSSSRPDSRRASSNRERASSRSRKQSSRRQEERRRGSSRPRSSRPTSSRHQSSSRPSEKRRSPQSYHERYLKENHNVIQHSRTASRSRSRGRSNGRPYSIRTEI